MLKSNCLSLSINVKAAFQGVKRLQSCSESSRRRSCVNCASAMRFPASNTCSSKSARLQDKVVGFSFDNDTAYPMLASLLFLDICYRTSVAEPETDIQFKQELLLSRVSRLRVFRGARTRGNYSAAV